MEWKLPGEILAEKRESIKKLHLFHTDFLLQTQSASWICRMVYMYPFVVVLATALQNGQCIIPILKMGKTEAGNVVASRSPIGENSWQRWDLNWGGLHSQLSLLPVAPHWLASECNFGTWIGLDPVHCALAGALWPSSKDLTFPDSTFWDSFCLEMPGIISWTTYMQSTWCLPSEPWFFSNVGCCLFQPLVSATLQEADWVEGGSHIA